MSELPLGYQPIPEEDRKKAKTFFDRGNTVAGTGQYDYAIEMFMQGLNIDPDGVEGHQSLRDISLKRKASGGKSLGMFEAMKLKRGGKDDKGNMINAEKLLAFDPGNTDHMLSLMQSALKGGFYDTVMWIGPILFRANTDGSKPDYNKYIALRDTYKALQQWKLASDACQAALNMRPDDMDLITELKNLGAQHTMSQGKYDKGGSFRDSIKDMDSQRKLLEQDMDVRSDDMMTRAIKDAEAEYNAQPNEPGKLMKLVEALLKTETLENENRAIDLLAAEYDRTKQFRFRFNIGKIKIHQLVRADRQYREKIAKNPQDESLREEYRSFFTNRAEEELKEYSLFAENYPTDLTHKYEMARRLFALQRYGEAIPVFQTARQDPKIRVDASTQLARAFLEAGFVDEAVDTLRALIEEYQLKGDTRSKIMYYWYARSLEQHGDTPAAIKAYSQVAQWDFNYLDVQARIKRLRSSGPTPAA
ncbi:MAG TPA: tetratricopeptide repeat protein [Tepidisphaeraceae bacterium]|nr:tetratricopeptide repeat protein [Tepidisphaeraceae bacterium]